MAAQDNPQGNFNQQGFDPSNILQQLQYSGDTMQNIDTSLRGILALMTNSTDAIRAGQRAPTESQSNVAENSKWKYSRENPNTQGQSQYRRSTGNILDDFENGIKDQLLDSLAGGNFKSAMQGALNTFAKEFGFNLRDLPQVAGREITKNAIKAFSDSKVGQALKQKAGELGGKLLDGVFKHVEGGDAIKDGIKNVAQSFFSSGKGGQGVGSMLGQAAQIFGSGQGGQASSFIGKLVATVGKGGAAQAGSAAAGSGAAGAALQGVFAKIGTAIGSNPYGLIIIAAILTAIKILGPALKGLAEVVKNTAKSFTRSENEYKKMAENAKKRQEADFKWLAERPFKILQEAAEKWAETWDANLAKIGQTQGYVKEDVYDLYESYAARLREEGLDAEIKATDIVNKLSQVLDTGLSGKAAEEFAYIATKFSAAVPTQDFFSYADTYASIAANAMSMGMSQEKALQKANNELKDFASDWLYASREIAGGLSTGLKDGASLFKDAAQIAQTARTYNASEISGTLTSISAIIGAVAPDLASALVQNVVQAAVGGNNNSQLVALRSLAGINAGNTEFLQAMARDPQGVFTSLFSKLATLQNMSPDNYMEVAEGLADVFGIDKAAFARVDFNYLATAIAEMNSNNKSFEENLALLASGQTTTSAEQLKAQEINKVILDEGLAYVIDSEAGRMIQEHMWEEQLTNAVMKNEFAVNLQGSALDMLEGIRQTITTLLNFLNPAGFIQKGIADITRTIAEAIGNEQDLEEILKMTAVGENETAFHNLTTRGKDLELVNSYVEMLGGSKGIWALNMLADSQNYLAGLGLSSSRFNEYNSHASDSLLGITDAYARTWFTSGANDALMNFASSYTDKAIDQLGQRVGEMGIIDNATNALTDASSQLGDQIASLSGGKGLIGAVGTLTREVGSNISNAINSGLKSTLGIDSIESRYNWSMVGKSFASALQGSSGNWLSNVVTNVGNLAANSELATKQAIEESNNRVEAFIKTAETAAAMYDENGKAKTPLSFSQWIKTVTDFGIAEDKFDAALYDYGTSLEDLKLYFQSFEAQAGARIEEGRKVDAQTFRDENRLYWDYTSGTSGIFQTAMWWPFFGDGRKYDTRMDAVDYALSYIQSQIGDHADHTVISGLEEISRKLGDDNEFTVISVLTHIHTNLYDTFVVPSSSFQRCLADWIRYIEEAQDYGESVSKSKAWSDYKSAEKDQQTEATLALANALHVFSAEELKKMDPQLQTNALLGEIVVILQSIMQQNNAQIGGLSLIDTISALGLGMTTRT